MYSRRQYDATNAIYTLHTNTDNHDGGLWVVTDTLQTVPVPVFPWNLCKCVINNISNIMKTIFSYILSNIL